MTRNTVWLTTASLFILACGSSTPTDNSGGTPAIALAISPSTSQLQPGGTTQVLATLTRTNFTGTISVAIEGAPSGVTGTASVNTTGASVSITAASSVPTGSYPITIRASGTGVTSVTKTFTLTIVAVSTSSFTLTLSNASPSVTAGASTSTTITIARLGFSGPVGFSIDGLVNYLDASVTANPTSGNTATLNITTTDRLTAGTYYINVRGSAAGQSDVVASVTLTVN